MSFILKIHNIFTAFRQLQRCSQKEKKHSSKNLQHDVQRFARNLKQFLPVNTYCIIPH